jgi:hypothetical protein
MSEHDAQTFRTVAEYRAAYYSDEQNVAATSQTPIAAGRLIGTLSLEVIQEAVAGLEPQPRLAIDEGDRSGGMRPTKLEP